MLQNSANTVNLPRRAAPSSLAARRKRQGQPQPPLTAAMATGPGGVCLTPVLRAATSHVTPGPAQTAPLEIVSLPCHAFDGARWRRCAVAGSTHAVTELKVLTYNVWFERCRWRDRCAPCGPAC